MTGGAKNEALRSRLSPPDGAAGRIVIQKDVSEE
jgi:hypothetical protein